MDGLLLTQPAVLRAITALEATAATFARHITALWQKLLAGLSTSTKATQVGGAGSGSGCVGGRGLATAELHGCALGCVWVHLHRPLGKKRRRRPCPLLRYARPAPASVRTALHECAGLVHHAALRLN